MTVKTHDPQVSLELQLPDPCRIILPESIHFSLYIMVLMSFHDQARSKKIFRNLLFFKLWTIIAIKRFHTLLPAGRLRLRNSRFELQVIRY